MSFSKNSESWLIPSTERDKARTSHIRACYAELDRRASDYAALEKQAGEFEKALIRISSMKKGLFSEEAIEIADEALAAYREGRKNS